MTSELASLVSVVGITEMLIERLDDPELAGLADEQLRRELEALRTRAQGRLVRDAPSAPRLASLRLAGLQ